MSSTRKLLAPWVLLIICLSAGPLHGQSPSSAPFGCPAQLQGTFSGAAPAGWQLKTTEQKLPLQNVSIYNLDKDGTREYELAPDDSSRRTNHVTQLWNLEGYRTLKIFIRCVYAQQVTISREIPQPLKTCRMEFNLDKLNQMTGSPHIACQ